MADEGCPNVQLDAPIFGAEVNMGMMTAQRAADLIAPCFEGVKTTRSLHFCNGNLRGRPISHALHCAPWVDILERLDGVVDVAAFEVKYFFQWIEREIIQAHAEKHAACGRHRRRRQLLGRIGQEIRERITDWARVVGEERLWVSPSCGFGRHPSRDIPVLRAKMENMVEAARTL